MHRNRAPAVFALVCLAMLAGCTAAKSAWPWSEEEAPVPQPVRELEVTVPADLAMPVVLQFWERNTLVIDLQGATSGGQFRLSRREGQEWPARIGFRMSPTRFEALEVRGAQRVVLPLTGEGSAPVTVELPPGTYLPATPALTVSWGARSAF